jgi:SAM-dependent methyltransferase
MQTEQRLPNSTPPAASITHVHVWTCLRTLLHQHASRGKKQGPVRILDAGCGNGQLLSYLQACLTAELSGDAFEVFGFDVADHGVQKAGFMCQTLSVLSNEWPSMNWAERIRVIGADQPWPFDSCQFDAVISNQVLEHVHDQKRFFSECYRVLKDGGVSFHLFPLKHYIYEGHLYLPWVHRIRSHDLLTAYIKFLSRLGLGKYRAAQRETGVSLAEFAGQHADYMAFWTNYLSESEALDYARSAGFRTSFRYTPELYQQKLRAILGKPALERYKISSRSLWDSAAMKLLRYVSSVTLHLEKKNTYALK